MKKKTNCLVPNCTNHPLVRGLCRSHYSYVSALVRLKKAPSFEVLEKQGKVLPRRPSGGGRRGAIGIWLNK